MDSDQLAADIQNHISPFQKQRLIAAVGDAYDRAVKRFSPVDGEDSNHFGITIYKYVLKRFENLTKDVVTGMDLRRRKSMIRLGIGPFSVAAYSCGTSSEQLISESFPNNDRGAPQLVDLNQFCLDLNGMRTAPRSLVLAHLGNAQNGLEALYLAVPAKKARNRISEWSFTELLWKRAAGDAESGADLPRAKPIAPAPLTLIKFPAEQPQTSTADDIA